MKRLGWFCVLLTSCFAIWRLIAIDLLIENQPVSASVWANIASLALAIVVFICISIISFFGTFFEKDSVTIEKPKEEK
jgi:hypothetical protein